MELLDSFLIPKGDGRAFVVQAGQHLRLTQPEGPQVIDFDAFNLDNPREYLGSSVTRRREKIHITAGNTLWTCPPWEREMMDIVADTVRHTTVPSGAITHDIFSGRCSRASRIVRYGDDSPGCQEILAKAIEPFGLTEDYVHDPFNIFMRTGVHPDGIVFWDPPNDVAPGDYIELVPRMPCIVAISACPGRSSGEGSRPVGVEIYDPA